MKRILIISVAIFFTSCVNNSKAKFWLNGDLSDGDYIQWSGDNTLANEMIFFGINHNYNFERAKALTFFETALKYDPSLFGPHVMIASLVFPDSEKQKYHVKKAKELVLDNNETSKLFVSLLDLEKKPGWPFYTDEANKIWSEMRDIEPKGKFIHFYYAFSLTELEEQISAFEELKDELIKNNLQLSMVPAIKNVLAYLYYDNGKKDKSKLLFDDYIKNYPEGYNPYDSMGEYFMKEGDLEESLKYYQKAVQNFPYGNGAIQSIREIREKLNN